MKRSALLTLSFALSALLACNQAATPSASGSAPVGGTGAATASTAPQGTAATSSKYVTLQVVAPEPNSKAGVDGIGWTVDLKAKGNGPAIDNVRPMFQQSSSPGMNTAFPGLVVLLKSTTGSTSGSSDPNRNLARMFQVIGLPNTAPTGTSTSGTSRPAASASAAATASGLATASGAASASAAATSTSTTTSSTTTDNETATATWFVQQNFWGADADVELTVFVVDGNAPDMVTDRSSLKIVSDEVTVRFRINGGSQTPSGTQAPGSASPSASPAASGTARPSPSATSTP